MTERRSFKRRKVLKSLGVTVTAGAVLSQPSTAHEQSYSTEVEFEKVDTWLKWGEIVGKTTSSAEYRTLQNYFEEKFGGDTETGFGTVLKAVKPGDEEATSHIVNIPVHGLKERSNW
ncbi:hypothetical protein [Natrinema sp. 1APR25-10V2]|uniref:hypothetical protein n=1 Tax=Natrinema sp. 1APR25-10V2 TaxID=2951081 RepID=UPI002876409A|nr:hypothetical protein [Natrinema sp. 1APR25-10V2]MDS0475253.1 hypothetical protein [Natrinema sp. 1APR25-10V2]